MFGSSPQERIFKILEKAKWYKDGVFLYSFQSIQLRTTATQTVIFHSVNNLVLTPATPASYSSSLHICGRCSSCANTFWRGSRYASCFLVMMRAWQNKPGPFASRSRQYSGWACPPPSPPSSKPRLESGTTPLWLLGDKVQAHTLREK